MSTTPTSPVSIKPWQSKFYKELNDDFAKVLQLDISKEEKELCLNELYSRYAYLDLDKAFKTLPAPDGGEPYRFSASFLNDGLRAYGFVRDNLPPLLVIRGTETTDPELTRIHKQADLDDIGRKIFEANKESITKWLTTNTKAVVLGHSLGGTIAERVAATCFENVAKLFTFSAPGIEKDLFNSFVKKTRKIEIVHIKHKLDLIPNCGERKLPGIYYVALFVTTPRKAHTDKFISAHAIQEKALKVEKWQTLNGKSKYLKTCYLFDRYLGLTELFANTIDSAKQEIKKSQNPLIIIAKKIIRFVQKVFLFLIGFIYLAISSLCDLFARYFSPLDHLRKVVGTVMMNHV